MLSLTSMSVAIASISFSSLPMPCPEFSVAAISRRCSPAAQELRLHHPPPRPIPHPPPQDRTTVSSASHILDKSDTKKPEIIQGDHGDILLHNFWKNGTDTVVNVRMTDCNAPSYDSVTFVKCLAKHKQAKKKKYLHACLSQRMHFTPLVFSVDGMMG